MQLIANAGLGEEFGQIVHFALISRCTCGVLPLQRRAPTGTASGSFCPKVGSVQIWTCRQGSNLDLEAQLLGCSIFSTTQGH